MSDKVTSMLRSGEISSSAAKRIGPRSRAQASKMASFTQSKKDEGAPTGNAGALTGDPDQHQTKSNMSEGAKAGRESQPIKRNQINDGKSANTRDAGSRVRGRNKKNRFNNKAKIYPSGPLAGGPNGRP